MSTEIKPRPKKTNEAGIEDQLLISEAPSGQMLIGTMTTEERLAEEKKYKDGKILEERR